MESNLASVAARLDLNAAEVRILRLALYLQLDSALKEMLNLAAGRSERRHCYRLMAQLLDVSFAEVCQALHPQHKLLRFGLLESNRHYNNLDDYLQWGDTLDADDLDLHPFDETVLLHQVVAATEPPTLQWSDYEHIEGMRTRMLAYMQHALSTRRRGVNILLYGAPGTGKTEFAAVLAQQLNIAAYTLASVDADGDALKGDRRLQKAALAQTLLAEEQALLVFDEIEDVFSGSLFTPSAAQGQKAWVNRFLENNPVPMVWISNDVRCMDVAFIRRFDLVLEMPDLPVAKKAALIENLAESRLAAHEVRCLSEQNGLTAAMLTRSFQVAAALDETQGDFGGHVFDLLNQTLHAQGRRRLVRPSAAAPLYSLDWVACDQDLVAISRGLQAHPRGRICCYGPPGTGKTAWAHWLGEALSMPVLLKRGSDLLGPFVGETEQKIAVAFAQATEQNAILVIDEVDSFLFGRDSAQRSWELGMVNEMLTQMEAFEGLLVVSTNWMQGIDSAALRRFDVKIAFDYLQPQQVLALAEQYRARLSLPRFKAAQRQRLHDLRQLTPGDFATVARRHRFAPFANVDDWLHALAEECRLKPPCGRGGMGFV